MMRCSGSDINALLDQIERLKAEILDARRVGRPPEAFWLEGT